MGQENAITQAGRNGLSNVHSIFKLSGQMLVTHDGVSDVHYGVTDALRWAGHEMRDCLYASVDLAANLIEIPAHICEWQKEGFNFGTAFEIVGQGATDMAQSLKGIAGSLFSSEKNFVEALGEGAFSFAYGTGAVIGGTILTAACAVSAPVAAVASAVVAVPAAAGMALKGASYALNSDTPNQDGEPARVPQKREDLGDSFLQMYGSLVLAIGGSLYAGALVVTAGSMAAIGTVLAPVAGATFAVGKVGDFFMDLPKISQDIPVVGQKAQQAIIKEKARQLAEKYPKKGSATQGKGLGE